MIVRYIEHFKGYVEREFTEEIHGENFESIAREFAVTNNGDIIHEDILVDPDIPKKNKGGRPKKLINSES